MSGLRPFVASAAPGIRVQTLVLVRWIAVTGQLLALLLVGLGLRYPLPWLAALVVIGAAIVVNLGLTWFYRQRDRIGGRAALSQLGFDLVQLSALLALTGGLANPFALLLLVPVTIAVTLLSARQTVALVLVALLLLVVLWFWHLPLPWAGGNAFELPLVYRLGSLTAIGVGMLFLTFYAGQVSAEARHRQMALIATQAALDRETRMGALGSLAAAAAHELGGPLGTITLIARDLKFALSGNRELSEDVQLLNQEVNRAREILISISKRAEADHPFPEVRLPTLLREVLDSLGGTRVPVELCLPWHGGAGPVVPRMPELLHGFSNLLSNAVRHARTRVWIHGVETADGVFVGIEDDGPGFSADLLPRLGEPFLGPSLSRSGSTGLGIFIATTLLERLGVQLRFENRAEGGARVECYWRHAEIEATRATTGPGASENRTEEGRNDG